MIRILPLTAAEHGRRHGTVETAMAGMIRGRVRAFGECGPADLARDGFTHDEIDLHYAAARAAADAAPLPPLPRKPALLGSLAEIAAGIGMVAYVGAILAALWIGSPA